MLDSEQYLQSGRIDTELACLFGKDTIARARKTDAVDLDLDAGDLDEIADTAGALLKIKGQPRLQRHLVNGLPRARRLALCMWLIDTEMVDRLLSR